MNCINTILADASLQIHVVNNIIGGTPTDTLTLPAGNNLGSVRPHHGITESRVNTYSLLLRLLYMAQACNLLVSSVKTM